MIGPGKKDYDVFIQDQTTAPFQYYLMREDKTDIQLTANTVIGEKTINVTAGHGFTAGGEYVTIMENSLEYQAKVISVNVNEVTLQIPFDKIYTQNATVIRGSIDMNVNASGAEQLFKLELRKAIVPIDIDTVIINMTHGANVPDDGKFGGIAALTNGMLFRFENSAIQNLGNFVNNQNFREFGANVLYIDSAPAGDYGTVLRFDIRDVYGIVIRVNPNYDDKLIVALNDDLSSLDSLKISIMGQYTLGEV